MKVNLSDKTGRFAKRALADFSEKKMEMLLEKCFFTKEQLSKEEALHAVRFLFGSVEKEAHRK